MGVILWGLLWKSMVVEVTAKETLVSIFLFISTIMLLCLASFSIAILFLGFVTHFSGNINIFKSMLYLFGGEQNEVQLAFMTGLFTALAGVMLIQLGIQKGVIEVSKWLWHLREKVTNDEYWN